MHRHQKKFALRGPLGERVGRGKVPLIALLPIEKKVYENM
jgi:hypothetical protein